jgi:DNA-binding PadR family transcriptional regulator
VLRRQPVTAYQLFKDYEQSPVSTFNTSKGSLYPLINRLKTRGLIAAEAKPGDKRNTEFLACTKAGAKAIAAWARQLDSSHVVLDDPLRSKLLSLDQIGREEQIEWVVDAKKLVSERMAAVEVYNQSVTVPFQTVIHNSATTALKAKMEWLDQLLHQLVKEKGQ